MVDRFRAIQQSTITNSTIWVSILPESLVESFRGLFGGAAGFGNFPFHLARANFILRDATGFAGVGVDDGRCTRLELASTASCHQDVPVIAVEAFDQLHWDVPP